MPRGIFKRSADIGARISAGKTGGSRSPITPETREKLRASQKIAQNRPEVTKKKVETRAKRDVENGFHCSKETKAKISSSLQGHSVSEESRKKMSLSQILKNKSIKGPYRDTKDERKVKEILISFGYKENKDFVQQYPITTYNHCFRTDFLLLETNIIIECDGIYWHCDPRKYSADFYNKSMKMTASQIWLRDEQRTTKLKVLGYKVLRFWEREVNERIIRQEIELVEFTNTAKRLLCQI